MENKNLYDSESHKAGKVRNTMRIELNFWRSILVNALGLLLAWLTLPADQIRFSNVLSFIALIVVIWFLNWILRPILIVFTLPFIIFTMGVGMLFINALIIYWSARLIPGDGLEVATYWAALWASFISSVTSWGLALMHSERIVRKAWKKESPEDDKKDDDVIDV